MLLLSAAQSSATLVGLGVQPVFSMSTARNIKQKSELFKGVRERILLFARSNGRTHLPWRKTKDPYKILVSEIMLQQTQVERVIPFYKNFLKQFPTIRALARAERAHILKVWSGLGYNRRAKFLHEAAQVLLGRHGGKVPRDFAALKALPGIGEYTAKAVRVFAWGEPEVLIETNVRAVIIHHFFPRKKAVSEKDVLSKAVQLAQGQDPRTWHAAMMDYGVYIKAAHGNTARKSAVYTKQKPFKGSLREVRGAIVKVLHRGALSRRALSARLPASMHERFSQALAGLVQEGMVRVVGSRVSL